MAKNKEELQHQSSACRVGEHYSTVLLLSRSTYKTFAATEPLT